MARARRQARQHEAKDTKNAADLGRAEAFKGTPQYKKDLSEAAYAGEVRRSGDVRRAATEAGKALERAQSAGALSRVAPDPLKLFLRGQFETGRAAVEDPLDVVPKTALGLGKYVVGAPAGLVETAAHPARTLRSATEDFDRRYGDLAKPGGPRRFRERVKKEGAAAEVVEGVGSVLPSGVVGGRVAQRAAEAGALGRRVQRVATARPALRVSGEVVRDQPVSGNLARNVARGGVDATRKVVQQRRARREDAPLEVRQAQQAGEVTFVRRGAQRRAQRVAVAREKGSTLARMRAVQQQETQQARRNIGSLSKAERRGFKHAMQTGAMTPQAARATIARRIEVIAAERSKRSAERPGYVVSRRRDELPELRWLHENADRVFTQRLRRVAKQEQARERRLVHGDPGVAAEQAMFRRAAPQAEVLGVRRGEGETNAVFLRRVARARRDAGLERPGYFPSEERARGAFSAFAVGGQRATEIPKAYRASLLRQGVESADPEAFVRGIARNVKRREQWNMVARNFERHAVDKLGDRSMRNRSIVELTRDLENAGVDPGSVAFWNPRRFFEASQRVRHDTEGAEHADALGQDVELGDRDLHAALRESVATANDLRTRPEDFARSSGWSVVPAEVMRELESQVRPSGLGGRVVDVTRGKVSRALLGNPAWLSFQIASNALMTGLAGVGPVDAVKAQLWWRRLTPEQRLAIEPDLGIHGWADEQTRLGATTNNRMVNAYRAWKTTSLYQAAHRANPLDVIFRADNLQNNAFRKAVAYNQAKREAYREMGHNAKRILRAQQQIQRLLKLDPAERILEAMHDPRALERHAQAVRDFLGDYTTYSARERRTIGRYAMFYGFLRNSLRMTFYTLPVEHPVIAAIGLELGKLHDDELHRLFGEDVPVWEQGSAFVAGRKFAVGRLNPFFNAVQYQGPGSLMQVGSPLLSIAADQVAGKNVAFDRLWRVGGSTQFVLSGKHVGLGDRARIALASLLHLSPYYRLAEETGIPGVAEPLRGAQSDTSSLLFPEPTEYKQGPSVARNARRVREQDAKGAGQVLQEQFLPIGGQPAAPVIERAVDYARSQGKQVPGSSAPLTSVQRRALGRARRARPADSGAAGARALARARRAAGIR